MKIQQLTRTVAALVLAIAALPASATFIARSAFDATAIDYGFTNSTTGALTAGDGFLTVSGAHVTNSAPTGMSGLTYTNDGAYNTTPGAAIRFDFASDVSEVGFTAYYNNSAVLFQVYNSANLLLESISISPTDCGGICGFIGLKDNGIRYAIATLPGRANIHNLYVDNIVYEKSVPEPATLALFGLGLLAFASRRKSNK